MVVSNELLTMGLTIFELWVMETEIWVMEINEPNAPKTFLESNFFYKFDSYNREQEIWSLNVSVGYTVKCQSKYNRFSKSLDMSKLSLFLHFILR